MTIKQDDPTMREQPKQTQLVLEPVMDNLKIEENSL